MRKLLSLTVVLAALYGGYWFVGSRAVLSGVESALTQLRAQGQVNYASVGLVGFPSRFDLTVEAPEVRGRDIRWTAPFLQVFALSYRPNQIIAVWPNEQSLTVAGQRIELKAEDMRASALFGTETKLPLDHAQMVVKAPSLAASGWFAKAREARVASQATEEDGRTHRIGVDVMDTDLTGLETGADVPATIDRAYLDATLSFDRPIDRFAGETPPRLSRAEISSARIIWGPMRIEAEGTVEVTASGTPEGKLTVKLTEWRQMLAGARTLGLLSSVDASNLERMFEGVARNSADPDSVSLPFDLRQGMVYLGPFPLGPAPRL
ncbi:DUF2125 domain-containing protein [Defluviimonas sp. WL0002]|uniref:DUF2125 domain-containing protein n=1 Tax=Albidovulum marisflavi TaxID=2984159 RepID=A0ABT2ZED3_9RHOB|nr:DUF2125 domain-containing protein [Defluviimonas sp. WL0002]MCV2869505.1 DUF2125 domain-containing protein [Defluviimonas sp. WL0002]